jgi:hypothetical protein
MRRFWLIYHRRTTKTCSVFLPFTSVYRPNRPVTDPYRAVYRSKPIKLVFQFGFWICSVLTGYRGSPTGLPKPVTGDSVDRFGKVNLTVTTAACNMTAVCARLRVTRIQRRYYRLWIRDPVKSCMQVFTGDEKNCRQYWLRKLTFVLRFCL